MIFLYILLSIVGAVILIALGLLFLPVTVNLKFKEDFFLKVRFCGIKVYELKQTEPEKGHTTKKDTNTESQEKKENTAVTLFKKLKKKYGFSRAVKKVFLFFKAYLEDIKKFLHHIRIKNIRLNIVYGTDDAADTAIKYGEICTAVYPVLSLIDTASNIEFSRINIQSDFEKESKEFDFSLKIRLQVFFLLISAFRLYSLYKNFLNEEELQ